jgi:hypothetical protein
MAIHARVRGAMSTSGASGGISLGSAWGMAMGHATLGQIGLRALDYAAVGTVTELAAALCEERHCPTDAQSAGIRGRRGASRTASHLVNDRSEVHQTGASPTASAG